MPWINHTSRLALIVAIVIALVPKVWATGVVVNEFQADTTTQKVELYNNSQSAIDISGWYIDDDGGSTYFTIPQGLTLEPNSCMSFEGSFSLNKSSPDTVRLFDSAATPTTTQSAHLVDSFSYPKAPTSPTTYQRIPDGTSLWATAPATFDHFNLSGANCIIAQTTPTPTQSVAPNDVYISELMPAPSSGTEWVELYNTTDSTIMMTNWMIDDIIPGGSSPHMFSLSLSPHSYGVVELPSAIFNNDQDSAHLLDNTGHIISSTSYTTTLVGTTWGRTGNGTYCLMAATRANTNSTCIEPTPQIASTSLFSSPSTYEGVFISEAQPTPEHGASEWVELYNDNATPVELDDWSIDDRVDGGSSPSHFSLKIQPRSYAIVQLVHSMFNTSGDDIRLLDRTGVQKDIISYATHPIEYTIGRATYSSHVGCSVLPTPSLSNSGCIDTQSSTPSPTPHIPRQIAKTSAAKSTTSLSHSQPPTRSTHSISSVVPQLNSSLSTTLDNQHTAASMYIASRHISARNKSILEVLASSSLVYSLLTIISIVSRMRT